VKNFRIIALLAFILSAFVAANSFAADITFADLSTSPSIAGTNTNTATTNTVVKPTTTNQGFTPGQVRDIQKIVHDYLINNPKVLVEVSQALQKQQAAQAQKNAMTAIQKLKQQIFHDPKTPTAGNPNGTVFLVEFFDYQCGHCKAMSPIVSSIVKNNKNVKVIFKELPIFGGASRYAAKMAMASTAQGKYYSFHNALFKVSGPLNQTKVQKIAKRVTLNVTKLKRDAAAPWVTQQLRANFRLAQELKLVGTPAFIIANKQLTTFRFIPGATSQANLDQQINSVK